MSRPSIESRAHVRAFASGARYSLVQLFVFIVAAAALAPRPALGQRGEALGQAPDRALTQYGVDRWDDRQGLPQNSVQAIEQTTDGYLWLGTQEGLVRFDGVRFTTFGRESIPQPYIWSLESDAAGGLWIGTEGSGLVHMKDGKFTAYTEDDGLPPGYITALHRDRTGTLWIATSKGGLARLRDGRFEIVGARGRPVPNFVMGISEDASGSVWVLSGMGATRFSGNVVKHFSAQNGLPGNAVYAAIPSDSGIWLGTNAGLVHVAGDRVRTYGVEDGLPSPHVVNLAKDTDGHLWMTGPGGLSRLSRGTITAMPAEEGPDAQVSSLFTDREGSVWLGTNGAGLMRLRETPFLPLGAPEGLPAAMVLPIIQDRAGSAWLGTGGAGVTRVDGEKLTTYNVQNGMLPGNTIFSIEETRDGAIWIGTNNGISRIQDGRATKFSAGSGLASAMVRDILEDRAGRIWVASNIGLQRFRPGPPKLYTSEHGLPDDFVMTLHEDRTGVMWIGSRVGLTRMDGETFTTFDQKHGLGTAGVNSIHEDANGTLWLASTGGIGYFRDGRGFTFGVAQGLCDHNVHRILEDDAGDLWFSANTGIFRLRKRDIADLAAGRIKKIECELYGRAEGMRSREANGAVNPAGWKMRDGRLWFPTLQGVVIIDPRNSALDLAPPPVAIEEVIANGRIYPRAPAELEAGTNALEIHFTGLSFVGPEKMRFRYMLQGFDKDWVDAGNRRVAYYTRIPPGRYTFRVAAANAAGDWSQQDASVSFRILPQFYQTAWFRALAVLAALAALVGVHRLRMRRLRKRANELSSLADERGRAEQRYRELFENASDAIFTTDLNGNFTGINRRAEEMIGAKLTDVLGHNIREFLPANEAGERTAAEWLSGRADASQQVKIVARDGTLVPVEVSTRLISDDGAVTGVQATARDVRDRAALEQQLQHSQKMEAVGQLAGGVAHDFNNLLTVIRGNTELLLGDMPEDGSTTRDDLLQIAAAADRAAALTRQLLAFSRKQVIQPQHTDLNVLMRDLEPMLRRLIGEDITIATLPSREPASVLADPGQLEQVLINLAVNARDAMPNGGTINIEIGLMNIEDAPQVPARSASGRCVVLTVSDTGTGMDAATRARIFEPFFTTKEHGKGTGLGLSTVYGIVQQAGGDLTCVSQPGSGTTFRIYLPYVENDGADAASAAADTGTRGGTETILLVEDEDAVRLLASRILRRLGYTVLETRHGRDALDLARSHPADIDLVVTDVVMPEMSGRELAVHLRAMRSDIRVLYISGYTDDEILRRGLHEPGIAFLQKPFAAASLAASVRAVLDRRTSPAGNAMAEAS